MDWFLSSELCTGEWVSDVTLRTLINDYYDDNAVGGNAHIVFDERGIEDSTLEFCIKQSIANGDWVCAGLLIELYKRDPKRREAILE